MNERIQKLYKEATGKDWAYDFDPVTAEKFAKLVVKECADVAVKFHLAHPYSVEYQIKKHFGVEE